MIKHPFRQIHLDFHTSEYIPGVGTDFDAAMFATTLYEAGVESVVLFSKCHHGWSYYDTTVGERHPNLDFDLLRQQYDACREKGLKTPVYISVGWDERNARANPGWRQIKPDGTFFCLLGENLDAAWSYMCVNSPYLDQLCAQIEEVVETFPEADGLWLDIIKQEQCCCTHCVADMTAKGLDFRVEADRLSHRAHVLKTYFARTAEAAGDIGLFHNTSMVPRGDREMLSHFSHMEIEAVPTGGWGYDHLPMSAKYLGAAGYDPLGVTVRFHVVWGELGGYKPTDALRFEAMTMLAHGCRVCIGDQLDPRGTLDGSAYRMIGEVFREVEAKEPFCRDTVNVADIGLVSSIAVRSPGEISREARHCAEDEGALKILQEGHYLFDVLDQHSDFSAYKLLVFPDTVPFGEVLTAKVETYLEGGGKILLTGQSGFRDDGAGFAVETGAEIHGPSPYDPTFILPENGFLTDGIDDPFVVMAPSLRVKVKDGAESLGDVFEPYFNRSPLHFNGHIHAGPQPDPSGFAAGVLRADSQVAYLPHPHFSIYRALGPHTLKAFVHRVIDHMITPRIHVAGFPASGTVTLRHQPAQGRYMIHMLYGAPRLKGETPLGPLEAIEDLPTLAPARIEITMRETVKTIETYDGLPVSFIQDSDKVSVETHAITGHGLYVMGLA